MKQDKKKQYLFGCHLVLVEEPAELGLGTRDPVDVGGIGGILRQGPRNGIVAILKLREELRRNRQQIATSCSNKKYNKISKLSICFDSSWYDGMRFRIYIYIISKKNQHFFCFFCDLPRATISSLFLKLAPMTWVL